MFHLLVWTWKTRLAFPIRSISGCKPDSRAQRKEKRPSKAPTETHKKGVEPMILGYSSFAKLLILALCPTQTGHNGEGRC